MKTHLIALLGGECTGKTTLARALAEHFGAGFAPEYLREWCATHARTPRREEQAGIAAEQARQIDVVARRHRLVFCDSTPLLTALYSQHYFEDTSLLPDALVWQGRCALQLLCAPDLPWEPDGMLRDGPQARAHLDQLLRNTLTGADLAWTEVTGDEKQRLAAAIQAVQRLI